MFSVLGLYGLSRDSHSSSGYSIIPSPVALDLLQFSVDKGVNTFDTAPGYGSGNASELLSSLSSISSNFYVNSKIGLDLSNGVFDLSLIQSHIDHLLSFACLNYSTIFLHSPPQAVIEDFELVSSVRKLILSKLGAHVKFGISLSSPADFASLDKLLPILDSLQVNLSWMDLRFSLICQV